jgi:release factor glutamine methyltransferase
MNRNMLTFAQAFYELKNKLQPLYDEREAAAIAHGLLHHITGLDRTQRLMQKEDKLTASQQAQYERSVGSLLQGTPLQYVTGTAWFMGKEYLVNNHVLIPRPETEELVQWVIDDWKTRRNRIIVDIGTGSGCISIALKSALPDAVVTAIDLSGEALSVAKGNAQTHHASIQFRQSDFLDSSQWEQFPQYDIIISNPPYIPLSDKESIPANVKDWEPSIALFVADDAPLVFYKAIAAFGKSHLNSNGNIYCELDPAHAAACKTLFEEAGYENVTLKKDIHGNMRMIKASFN